MESERFLFVCFVFFLVECENAKLSGWSSPLMCGPPLQLLKAGTGTIGLHIGPKRQRSSGNGL